MNDEQFRMLLNLCMVSDPWPLTKEENDQFIDMLNKEAKRRGYSEWVSAYHEFTPAT